MKICNSVDELAVNLNKSITSTIKGVAQSLVKDMKDKYKSVVEDGYSPQAYVRTGNMKKSIGVVKNSTEGYSFSVTVRPTDRLDRNRIINGKYSKAMPMTPQKYVFGSRTTSNKIKYYHLNRYMNFDGSTGSKRTYKFIMDKITYGNIGNKLMKTHKQRDFVGATVNSVNINQRIKEYLRKDFGANHVIDK